MFTNNFHKVIGNLLVYGTSMELINTTNDSKSTTKNFKVVYDSFRSVSSGYGTTGVVFGSGDTPPSRADYKLSGSVITGVSGTVVNEDYVGNDYATHTSVITVTNGKEESITVKEIGAGYSPGGTMWYLLDRTVLAEPLEIPPRGVGVITYTVNYNYPDASTATGEVVA